MTETPCLTAEEHLVFDIVQTLHYNVDGVHFRPKPDQVFFSSDTIAVVARYRDGILEGRTSHDN